MRRSARLWVLLAALLLVAAACGDDEPEDEPTNEDAAADADADANGDEEADEADEEDSQEFAEATFNGESIAFSGVSCGTLPVADTYEIRGRIDGGGHLQARFDVDSEASGDEIVLASETPTSLDLFFPGEGGTIGDGEGFETRGEGLAALDASVTHLSGSVDLEPDTDTRSPETTPDGGTVEFELVCG